MEKPQEKAQQPEVPKVPEWKFPSYDDSDTGKERERSVKAEAIDKGLRYTWPSSKEDVVYRVVTSNEDYYPDNPDDLDNLGDSSEVGHTEETFLEDAAPLESGFRVITVWAYPIIDRAKGALGQGRLFAKTVYVRPASGVKCDFDNKNVRVSWDPISEGIDVRVVKKPSSMNLQAFRRGGWRAAGVNSNRHEFIDGNVKAGQVLGYAVILSRSVDRDQYDSEPPAFTSYTVPIKKNDVIPVTDLKVECEDESRSTWRLTWSKPDAGETYIYLTVEPPPRENEIVGDLSQAGFSEAAGHRYTGNELRDENGGSGPQKLTVGNVPWPKEKEWDTVYLTPVTVLGTWYRIGKSEVQQREHLVRHPKVRQRVSWQQIAFEWPGEASIVRLYQTSTDVSEEEFLAEEIQFSGEIERERYKKEGGFTVDELAPGEEVRIWLRAGVHFGGKTNLGPPTRIDVCPPWELTYTLEWPKSPTRETELEKRPRRWKRTAQKREETPEEKRVNCRASFKGEDLPDLDPSRLVMVYHPSRLPLSVDEDQVEQIDAEVVPPQDSGGLRTLSFDPSEHQGKGGYYRLLVDAEPEELKRYALLDPPLSNLRNQWL